MQQLKDTYMQNNRIPLSLYWADCDMLVDTGSPVSAKILPYQLEGTLKHFPFPWSYSQLSVSHFVIPEENIL